MFWIRLQTRDIRLRTDMPEQRGKVYAETYQRMRDAIADNELPCGFEKMTERIAVIAIDEYWKAGASAELRENEKATLDRWAALILEAEGTAFQLTAVAEWYRRTDRSAQALGVALRALEQDPSFWRGHESAGLSALALERYELAVEELTIALRGWGHADEDARTRLRSELAHARSGRDGH